VLGIVARNKLRGILLVGFRNERDVKNPKVRSSLKRLATGLGQHLLEFTSRQKRTALSLIHDSSGSTPAIAVSNGLPPERTSSPALHEREFQKLLEYGQLLLLKIGSTFRITEICGNSEKFFGLPESRIIGYDDIWEKLFDSLDLRRMALRIRRMGKRAQEFSEEVRYRRDGETVSRWLLVKATPIFEKTECVGWEAFVVDITDRRSAEAELRVQRQRIEALYEVSRALRVNVDPALVALKGLNALIRVTHSTGGLCCFYDQDTQQLEVVAAEGLSQTYVDGISGIVAGPNLLRYSIDKNKGLRLENIQNDVRAAQDLARQEGVKGAIIMPLSSGSRILGALVVFSPIENKYTQDDFQMVAAAASQISFAARQAEFYTAEKQEAEAFAALYRLSHELSRLSRGQEIGEHLFFNIQQQFAFKRAWFGIMNNQGTHIVGQAGMGPGIRQPLRDVQIELGLRHDFLDEALDTKQPVIIPAGTEMECSGLNKFFQRMSVGTLVVLPLVSLGQVVGAVAIEPVIGSSEYIQKKLTLLVRMANEVATVLMARRFEERVAESDKMRVANMLASGVAHNFNNLLQTMMGHASLIQMQSEEKSPVQEIATAIIDSAGKGAALVRQLLELASGAPTPREEFSLSQILEDSKDLFTSLLGGEIDLRIDVHTPHAQILGDVHALQQVISNLLVNAKEAIGEEREGGLIQLSLREIRLNSGEVDPQFAPGSYARLDVKDNGQGMDEERMARCFEPFYSSKSLDESTGISLSGAGLGLSSAYSIVQQHGGMITVASAVGDGTTFSLFFPLVGGTRQGMELKPQLVPPSLRTLLLLPGGSPAASVQSVFEQFGIKTWLIHDLDEALTLREDGGLEDTKLIVIDADYFGKSTLRLLDELEQSEENPSLIITTVSRRHWSELLEDRERVVVVEKPLGIRSIQKVIKQLFQSSDEEPTEGKKILSERVERVATRSVESESTLGTQSPSSIDQSGVKTSSQGEV
jgi:PAS domain S-box-containing protein